MTSNPPVASNQIDLHDSASKKLIKAKAILIKIALMIFSPPKSVQCKQLECLKWVVIDPQLRLAERSLAQRETVQ